MSIFECWGSKLIKFILFTIWLSSTFILSFFVYSWELEELNLFLQSANKNYFLKPTKLLFYFHIVGYWYFRFFFLKDNFVSLSNEDWYDSSVESSENWYNSSVEYL